MSAPRCSCDTYNSSGIKNTCPSAGELMRSINQLNNKVQQQASRIKELEGAIERMRVAGGSAEFHRMFELAKDLL
jgi:methyl-accepting chemotaxis protein